MRRLHNGAVATVCERVSVEVYVRSFCIMAESAQSALDEIVCGLEADHPASDGWRIIYRVCGQVPDKTVQLASDELAAGGRE